MFAKLRSHNKWGIILIWEDRLDEEPLIGMNNPYRATCQINSAGEVNRNSNNN
jgi:hypothetical protein